MFDSPEEQEKKYRDVIEISEESTNAYEVVKLRDLLISLYGESIDESTSEIIPEKDNTYTDSIVTVQDFDLNLFSERSKEYDELENESFGDYGYNFDQYLQQFPGSSSKLFKGMLKITKDFDTHAGALLEGDNIVVNLAVQLSLVDKVYNEIKSGSFGNILSTRDIIIIRKSNTSLYNRIFSDEENFKELLMLPVKYNKNKSCYLILFYTEIKKDIINDIENLNSEL